MSRKLGEFVQLMARQQELRSDTEMSGFVHWFRRRSALLKNLEPSVLVDVMRHAKHIKIKRNDVIFQQGQQRTSREQMRFFLFLRGSASMYVNKFLATHRKHSEVGSSAKTRTPASPEKMMLAPKSASSRRTSSTRKSPSREQATKVESDVSDAESEVSIETAVAKYTDTATDGGTRDELSTNRPTPVSKLSRASKKETPRAKFGRFVVKYEKGKYFNETAILDDDGSYAVSILANEVCELLVLEEEFFNKSVKEQHERETTDMLEFVDLHPFFCNLPTRAKAVLQVALKKHHFNTGDFIVKQEETADKLFFIVSGSAEVIVEPSKHRYQFPEYWPFETSKDVYYNEFEWLRESRRRTYSKKYEYHVEDDFQRKPQKVEVSLCAVQKKEVIGIIEHMLQLDTYIQNVRCLQPTEVYSLSIRPFTRLIKRRSPDTMDLVRAYVQMKLKFRIEHSLGEKVPLMHSLYVKAEREYREKSLKVLQTKSLEKLREREIEMLKLLEWFKMDKAELVKHMDVDVVRLKDVMQKKARRRERFRKDVKCPDPLENDKASKQAFIVVLSLACWLACGQMINPLKQNRISSRRFITDENTFRRSGCLAVAKPDREAMSLRALRDPMNEVILRLRMEGSSIKSEQELEDFLRSYTKEKEQAVADIRSQTNKVTEEEINLLHFRRRGNKLVRRFLKLLSHKGRRSPLTKEETLISNILLEHYGSDDETDEEKLPIIEEESEKMSHARSVRTDADDFSRKQSGVVSFEGWHTRKSIASSYRTYQFERRSITPSTLEAKIRNFHIKYGAKDKDINTLPGMRVYDEYEANEPPIPGGKVFVTTVPCISVCKNVHIKNHKHERCQMLQSLPMSKVKERSPTVEMFNDELGENEDEDDDDEMYSPGTFRSPTTYFSSMASGSATFRTPNTFRTPTTLISPTMLRTPTILRSATTVRSTDMTRSPTIV